MSTPIVSICFCIGNGNVTINLLVFLNDLCLLACLFQFQFKSKVLLSDFEFLVDILLLD